MDRKTLQGYRNLRAMSYNALPAGTGKRRKSCWRGLRNADLRNREVIPMDRKTLQGYRKNKRELALLDKTLEKLRERQESVPVVSGKVTKSSDDFPYIEEHVTVQMQEPKESTDLKLRIREKELQREGILQEMNVVETWIAGIPGGMERQILELHFLEGIKQHEVADTVGYTQSMVSKIINNCVKDS